MKTWILAAALLLPFISNAHEAHAPDLVQQSDQSGLNVIEGRVVVKTPSRVLKKKLFAIEQWPSLFTDARALVRKGSVWSVDFKQFGHPHDFTIRRAGRGVTFNLAAEDHGVGRLEYTLEPIDIEYTALKVRLTMSTPPQLTQAQMMELMRTKVVTDLRDLSRAAQR